MPKLTEMWHKVLQWENGHGSFFNRGESISLSEFVLERNLQRNQNIKINLGDMIDGRQCRKPPIRIHKGWCLESHLAFRGKILGWWISWNLQKLRIRKNYQSTTQFNRIPIWNTSPRNNLSEFQSLLPFQGNLADFWSWAYHGSLYLKLKQWWAHPAY